MNACFYPWLLSLLCVALHLEAAEPLPLTDNEKPPYLGVWKEPRFLPQGLKEYNTWLNRTRVWADISPCSIYPWNRTWPEIEMPFDPLWKGWMEAGLSPRTLLDMGMLPRDGSTLAQGATGAYNSHFATLAKNLVDNHLAHTIICLGPGPDPGVPWKVLNEADAANFVLYWKQIVQTMRAVPGAEKLEFDWIAPTGKLGFNPEDAYPGKDYVDYIGVFLGEGSPDKRAYPYPPFASETERYIRQKVAWDHTDLPLLQTWAAFALAHGKPFSLPCWNTGGSHLRNSGIDAPYFIEAMARFVRDPDNHVYFASYFEYYHYSQLSPTNGYTVVQPLASEAYHRCFALPAETK